MISRSEVCSIKNVFQKVFGNSQENNVGEISIFNNVAGLARHFVRKETPVQVFSVIFKNAYFAEQLRKAASE